MPEQDDDELDIAAVQCPLRLGHETAHEAAETAVALMRDAAAKQIISNKKPIDLFVLPELAPVGYTEHTFAKYMPYGNNTDILQEHINVEELLAQEARALNAFVCFGTIGCAFTEHQQQQGETATTATKKNEFTIRQVVLDSTGQRIATYDKIHLCDYGDCAETRFFVPGPNKPCSFACRGFTIGLLICADMRNPTLSRSLAGHQHKVDVLVQPAAFSRDVSFRTWRSFREVRAVENSVYFVGVNYSGLYYGESSFVEPWVDEHHEPLLLGTEAGVLVGTAKRSVIQHVRTSMPYYKQLLSEQSFSQC